MCVENHLVSSRKRVEKLPFNLISVPLWRWRMFVVKRRALVPLGRNPNSWELADSCGNKLVYPFFKKIQSLYHYKRSLIPHKQIILESLHRNTVNTKKPGIIESSEVLL